MLQSMRCVEGAQFEISRNRVAGAPSLARHPPIVEAIAREDVEAAAPVVADHLTPVFACIHRVEEQE